MNQLQRFKYFILIIMLGVPLQDVWSAYQELDRVAAVVSKAVITDNELKEQIEIFKTQILQSGRSYPSEKELRDKVLEGLILELIQVQLAENSGIDVSDVMLNDALKEISAKNGGSLSIFKKKLEKQGMPYEQVRTNVKKDLLLNMLRQQYVGDRIRVNEQEIDKYLNSSEGKDHFSEVEYRLGHIIIRLSENASSEELREAQSKAEQVKRKLSKGESLTKLTGEYVQGPERQTGDLGWLSEEELPTLFFKTAEKLKLGEVAIVKSAAGLHVFLLIDARGGHFGQTQDQMHVRRMVFPISAIKTDLEAEKEAEKAYHMVLQGKDSFSDIAKAYSNDNEFALNGGDMDWVAVDFLPKEVKIAGGEKLNKKLLKPFKTSGAWWVVEILGRRKYDVSRLLKRNKARMVLEGRLFDDAVHSWLKDIRSRVFVEIKSY